MGIIDKYSYFVLTQRKNELERALRRSPDWYENVSRQKELDSIREQLEELANKK